MLLASILKYIVLCVNLSDSFTPLTFCLWLEHRKHGVKVSLPPYSHLHTFNINHPNVLLYIQRMTSSRHNLVAINPILAILLFARKTTESKTIIYQRWLTQKKAPLQLLVTILPIAYCRIFAFDSFNQTLMLGLPIKPMSPTFIGWFSYYRWLAFIGLPIIRHRWPACLTFYIHRCTESELP